MARPLPPFDAEFALVTACALLDDASLRRAAPALLGRAAFDWGRLAELAFYHEVEQLMRMRLEEAAPGVLPGALHARIQQALVRKSALQAAQTSISVKLTQALAEAGIRSLLIKGAGLSHRLYAPHPELRTSNDIDIVVAPEDLGAADRVLTQAGLIRSWPAAEPPAAARAMLLQLANVFDYRGPVFNELVELHCRPTLNPLQALIERVGYIVPIMSLRVPWRSDCLVQALAARHWLARGGIQSELCIGVRKGDEGFGAHAWLKVGERVVTGGDISTYAELPLSRLDRGLFAR